MSHCDLFTSSEIIIIEQTLSHAPSSPRLPVASLGEVESLRGAGWELSLVCLRAIDQHALFIVSGLRAARLLFRWAL